MQLPPGKVQLEAISYLSYSTPSFLTHHTMGHLYKMKENYLQTINVAKWEEELSESKLASRQLDPSIPTDPALKVSPLKQFPIRFQHLERFDTSHIICMLKFWFSTNCSKISESASSRHFKYDFYL